MAPTDGGHFSAGGGHAHWRDASGTNEGRQCHQPAKAKPGAEAQRATAKAASRRR